MAPEPPPTAPSWFAKHSLGSRQSRPLPTRGSPLSRARPTRVIGAASQAKAGGISSTRSNARPAFLGSTSDNRAALLHGEWIDYHCGGELTGRRSRSTIPIDENVLELCTGSGCLAVLASRNFTNARSTRWIFKDASPSPSATSPLRSQERVTLHRETCSSRSAEALLPIISNQPYVDAQGMAELPVNASPKQNSP